MSKNIIFCFTGTGNSLRIAKDISQSFQNISINSMKNANHKIDSNYDSIGFFFPTYFGGLPMQVKRFINGLSLKNNDKTYFYAITTFANFSGNPFAELNDSLKKHGVFLNYASKIKMPNSSPYMNQNINWENLENNYNLKKAEIISCLHRKVQMKFKPENSIYKAYNRINVSRLSIKVKSFNVSNDCKNCGLCQSLCPVSNIEILNGKPDFRDHCEQCMACIQMCPKKAINYKNKTQNKPRYRNRHITVQELIELNKE